MRPACALGSCEDLGEGASVEPPPSARAPTPISDPPSESSAEAAAFRRAVRPRMGRGMLAIVALAMVAAMGMALVRACDRSTPPGVDDAEVVDGCEADAAPCVALG
jgi:hypothetical protein